MVKLQVSFMKCSIKHILRSFVVAICLSQVASAEKPNIIVILADDLGYGSVGSYGAAVVSTPNIDRIAREGIRFTDASTPSSVCTPTRYGLMMGEYPWRQEIGLPITMAPMQLPANRPNIASMLQSEGYATGVVGKWHLGFGDEPVDWQNSLTPGPLERGFDYYFGFPINLNNPPVVYIENHQLIHPEDPLDQNGKTGAKKSQVDLDTVTDVITGKAVAFIEKNKEEPFFLYFATHQVHIPIHPAPRFVGKSDAGIYGDFIEDCDWSVGQILDTLDRLELSENTLIFFTSDNGAIGWPATYKGEQTGGKDGDFGFFRNAPWSGFKFGTEQGGSRVPFVARWPGKIRPSSESDTLISLVDFYATFRELLGQQDDEQGIDSVSFLGHLIPGRKDGLAVRRSHTVYHAGKNSFLGIREKEWLLTFGGIPKHTISGKTGESMPGRLYHLPSDPEEKRDVYEQYPEVVQRIEQEMQDELAKKESPYRVSNGQIIEVD